MSKVIDKKDLIAWLNLVAQERILIAPVNIAGLLFFKNVSKAEEIVLDYDNTVLSPKDWFFPSSAVLFTMDIKDKPAPQIVPARADQEAVLFGLHPCEAKGITILDKPFLAAPPDAFYQQRRAHTTLVGIACRLACAECFCTSLGTAPDDPTNLDVLLTEAEDVYIVQTMTEKGKVLLEKTALKDSNIELPSPPSPTPVPTERIVEAMSQVFNNHYWSRVADRCIHCNICAYVCPVCYCFDMRDYVNYGQIERVRSWESCQSPGFTRIAGGYDPRPTKGARLRQRFYHKLLYMPEKFGILGCTGCGRCVRSCPVNIDIREIISDVQKIGGKDVR